MKFIVIEGLDGSGKSTQLKKIQTYFSENNLPYKYLHFPRTDAPVFGELIAKFLRGDLGRISEVNPYLVSLIYAEDRNNAAKQIKEWLAKGYTVIVDRYVYSNIAFQCAKLEHSEEKEELSKWIKHLEFEYFGIPKPDVNLFLNVPFEFTKRNLSTERSGDDRHYLNGKKDIHEASIEFQQKVKTEYLRLVCEDADFIPIECGDIINSNVIASAEEIFERIIEQLKPLNLI